MEIHDTDKVTVSYVAGGKTYSTTFQVGEKTLQDIFQAAEDANTKDTIFANKANKSVVASGLTTGAHDETVLNNAIDKAKQDIIAAQALTEQLTQSGFIKTPPQEILSETLEEILKEL